MLQMTGSVFSQAKPELSRALVKGRERESQRQRENIEEKWIDSIELLTEENWVNSFWFIYFATSIVISDRSWHEESKLWWSFFTFLKNSIYFIIG